MHWKFIYIYIYIYIIYIIQKFLDFQQKTNLEIKKQRKCCNKEINEDNFLLTQRKEFISTWVYRYKNML
jgi:hypothetical protein